MAGDVLVLGASGMFGHVAAAVLARKFEIVATGRPGDSGLIPFDVLQPDAELLVLLRRLRPDGVILNAVALTASQIVADAAGRERAMLINGTFPHRLVRAARELGLRVLHISTDGVFPPDCGPVTEDHPVAPQDVYGKSKAAGEVDASNCITIRCSLVGPPALRRRSGLWAWVCDQPPGVAIPGYVNQIWSGLSTEQLAETCAALVDGARFAQVRAAGATHHLAPNPALSKFDLVTCLARILRPDIRVEPAEAPQPVSRLLRSRYKLLDNLTPLWPSWPETLIAAARH